MNAQEPPTSRDPTTIVLHAAWCESALHLWGERIDRTPALSSDRSGDARKPPPVHPGPQPIGDRIDPLVRVAENSILVTEEPVDRGVRPQPVRRTERSIGPRVVPSGVLRRLAGEIWDGLLVASARSSRLHLELPVWNGRYVNCLDSPSTGLCALPSDLGPTASSSGDARWSTHISSVSTLCFQPADAFDLLTGQPRLLRRDTLLGDSLRFWSSAAGLVRELLAHQKFVPDILERDGHYYGIWRPLASDESTTTRLSNLLNAMPNICRSTRVDSAAASGEESIGARLLETFVGSLTDAVVRRCLEGDELTHSFPRRPRRTDSVELRWLRGLTQPDARIHEVSGDGRQLMDQIRGWLRRADPRTNLRQSRLCFRLDPPVQEEPTAPGTELDSESTTLDPSSRPWMISVYVQSLTDPKRMELIRPNTLIGTKGTSIFPDPLDDARERFQEDFARAARHFPILRTCWDSQHPSPWPISVDQAYAFLRDAVPLLNAEGFGLWLPRWWRSPSPRLSLSLQMAPESEGEGDPVVSAGLDALVRFDWRVALGDDVLSEEELEQLAASQAPLVQIRGHWLEVQPSDVRTALRFLRRQAGGNTQLLDALRQAYASDDSETGLPVVGVRASGWLDRLLNAAEGDDRLTDVPQPDPFAGSLRSYQRTGLSWLSFMSRHHLGACLADDMGLGKTIQLIALLLHEREGGGHVGPTLLIVPMSLVGNWRRELARFSPSLDVLVHHGIDRLSGDLFRENAESRDVVIATYGLVHRDHDLLAAVPWYRVVLDEAQNIKNPSAKQSVAIRSLRAAHRVALTGTPIENRLSELWSIMEFLNPGYLGGPTEFRRRFAVPIERQRNSDRAARLRGMIRPFVLRRLKTQPGVLDDLPDKVEMTVYCGLTREQAGLYEAVVRQMLTQVETSEGIQRRGLILATLTRLKQICNHPAHYLHEPGPLSERSGKTERLAEMLDELLDAGDKALVFTQYRAMGELLHRHLHDVLGENILFMHGGSSARERDDLVERFQTASDARVFVLSLKTGGMGLTLTAAQHVFHYDRWWNPAVEDQATDRAHRIGQPRRVQVHKFVCMGTLEERIGALLEQKRSLARNVVAAGEEWITELSTDALRDLLTLSREAITGE